MANKEALDALNAAIAPAIQTPEPAKGDEETPDGDTDGENDEGASAGEVADPAAGGTDGGEKPAAAGEPPAKDGKVADGEKPAVGAKPDDKAKKPDGEKPAEGAAKPDDKAPKAPAKAADPVNDPIPATVSERTRERITSLISTVKTQEVEVRQGRELFESITSTGMTAEELGTMLTYSRLVHSDKVEDKRTAFTFLQSELRGLALQLGETAAGVDLLAEHPDLSEALESGTITEKHAREVALSREQARVTEAGRARQTETAAEAQTAYAAGVAALDDLGTTLRAVDPQYEAKATALQARMPAELKKLHPSKWVAHFRAEYAKLTTAAPVKPAAPAGGAPAGGDAPQPLRPNKQPSGDGTKQPTSAREALDAALGGLGA